MSSFFRKTSFWNLFSFAYLAAAVSAGPKERKVPPRTPPQRLETLERFFLEYVQTNLAQFDGEAIRDTAELEENLTRIRRLLMLNYSKVNDFGLRVCSFFDPNVPNGGPRPADEMAKRDLWVYEALCQLDSNECQRKRRDLDEYDPFDAYEEALQDGERSASPRLSENIALALRQVTFKSK